MNKLLFISYNYKIKMPEYAEQYVPTRCDQMRPGYKYQFKLKNSDELHKVYLIGFSICRYDDGYMKIDYEFETELDQPATFSSEQIDESTLMEMLPGIAPSRAS